MQLILASASPRRRQLLTDAGYDFAVEPADVDETPRPGLSPADVAQQLACAKAEVIAARHPDDVVLGADTLVCFGERILGKPADADDARRILSLLSGTTQVVITGICVARKSAGFSQSTRVLSAVRMRPLSRQQIEAYIATGEWQGKAGAYGIQDQDPFVTRIGGSHTNVVGLPCRQVRRLLSAAGIEPSRLAASSVSA
jgi:septum formation protein